MRRFSGELEAWLRAELQRRGGRRRSVNLPGGTIELRLHPERLGVIDEREVLAWSLVHLRQAVHVSVETSGGVAARLLEWARQHGSEVCVRQKVLHEPLAQHFSTTGEIPPGTGLLPAEDRFFVK